jgi:hypothetical protein
MRKSGQEEWMNDVRESQRNVVFPDTLRNEVSGWRRLMTSGRPLTIVQKVGIGLLYLGMGVVFWAPISDKLRRSAGSPFVDRVLGGFGTWIGLFAIFGLFSLLLRWRVRRALPADKHRASGKHDLK